MCVGVGWAIVGGTRGGTLFGMGAAVAALATDELGGDVSEVLGLIVFSVSYGFMSGMVTGALIGVLAAPIVATWLVRCTVRNRPIPSIRARARVLGVAATTIAVVLLTLWLHTITYVRVPALVIVGALTLPYAPYAAGRMVRAASLLRDHELERGRDRRATT